MRKLMATYFVLGLTCAFILIGATCVDTATGTQVTKNPDGTTTVTQNPNNPVAVAGQVAGSLPLPFAGLIGAAIAGFPGIWAAFRGKQWKNAAVATAQAAGTIVSKLPDSNAKTAALAVMDTVHDAAGVLPAIQQPLQAVAAAHAGV